MDASLHFDQLLLQLLSENNDARKAAEQLYDNIPYQVRLSGLLTALQRSQTQVQVRQLAAVLLRRIALCVLDKPERDPVAVPKTLLDNVRQTLLILVQSEENGLMRRKLCDAIAEWARYSQDDNGVSVWPDVLKFLFAAASSPSPDMKECALTVLTNFPGVFGEQETRYRDVIKQMLLQSLNNENMKVQSLAVQAMVAYINSVDEHTIKMHFADLIPLAAQIVEKSAVGQSDDEVLKSMIEMAESSAKILRSHVPLLFDVMLKIAGATDLEDSYRQLGLEFIVTVAEEGSAMVRKNVKYLELIIPQTLAFMLDLEDSPKWSTYDEEVEDEDSDSNAVAGETSLDRLACALGGKVVLPYVMAAVSPMLTNGDWRYRHAAIMAISAIGEGCHTQMQTLLPQLVEAILPFLQDPHPRVRFAVCNCVGQMAVDFAKGFQKEFHMKVIPSLLHVMGNNDNPRVQGHAAAALMNFVENCPKQKFIPYLQPSLVIIQNLMASKLPRVMEKGAQTVLEQLITTLAMVADTTEEAFIPFYDDFMPSLKHLLENLTLKEQRMMRGRVIECISLIGLAVGRDKFLPDADGVLELLLKAQTDREQFDDDDPQVAYLISAWTRMCKLLQKDFLPYLPVIMPHVLKTAKLEPEFMILDGSNTDLDVSLAHPWSSEVIFSSASTEGAAALRREQTKAEKYSMERLPGEEAVRLVPLVLEHFGHWGQQAEKYLHQLSLRSTDECGNSNSSQFKTYWRERLSVQLQRCNSRVIYRKVEGLLDRDDDDSDLDDDEWESITLSDQRRFGIKTGGLEDKCTACQMLVCYARDLEEGFVDYVNEVASLMIPLLKFILHEGVRLAAADSLPCLLHCAKPKGDEYVLQLWNNMFSALQSALEKEPEKEVAAAFLDSLCKCVTEVGARGVTREQIGEIIRMLQVRLGEHFKSLQDIQQKRREEDYDEGVEEDLQCEGETNEILLSRVADVIHNLFVVHRDELLPYFNPLCPIFASMLAPEHSPAERQWSLCVFDDVLEFAGSSAGAYQEYFIRPMLEYVLDKHPAVRQAASYGFGVMAQFCGQEFEGVCQEALPRLCQACNDPNCQSDNPSKHAMENAVSAIVKMCRHKPAIVPQTDVLPLFLTWLPVTEDNEEAEHIYSYFCDLIAGNHPLILGEGNSNLPRIVAIIADALDCGVLEDETKGIRGMMTSILRHIQVSGDIWSACLEQLTGEQRMTVMECIISG